MELNFGYIWLQYVLSEEDAMSMDHGVEPSDLTS
jgi:hypothetical protein